MEDIVSKLYLPQDGGGYSESNTLVAVAEGAVAEGTGRSRLRTRFRFTAQAPLSCVRFDPVAAPGVAALHRVEWSSRDALDSRAVFADEGLAGIARIVNGVALPRGRSSALAFWAINGDPQVELTLPTVLAGVVELVLDWSFEALDPAQNDALAGELLDRIGYPPAAPGADDAPADPVPAQLQQLLVHGAAVDAALAAGEQACRELASRLAQVEQLAGEQTHVAAGLAQQIEALAQQLSALQELDEAQRLTLAEAASAQEQAQQRLIALEQTNAALAQTGAALQQRLHALELQTPEQVARRRREARLQRRQHWKRQTLAWLDLVRPYRLVAEPLGDVEPQPAAGGGPARWRATSSDPRFLLRWRGPAPSSGWYLLEAEFGPIENTSFADPCFYVDYGQGMSEDTRVMLSFDADRQVQRCLVKFDGDVSGLRFDPSIHPCQFTLGRIRLRKLSRAEVALRMADTGLRELKRTGGGRTRALKDAWAVFRKEGMKGVEQRLRQFGEASASRHDYDNWVRCFDTIDDKDRQGMRAQIAAMPRRPTFSIVMPTYNTPERWLELCIDSVLRQLYPDWELCIADDASTAPHVRAVLERHAARDPRIRLCFREKNGHIVAASNSALELATGEYVVLLDHDDELSEHALFLCAHLLNARPGVKLIYSDEDKIDENGRRYDPYFKPDWNPDLFLSHNMISHLGVYSTELVRAVGGFRKGYEGSQDYDLALRCIEKLSAEEIAHVPHVLYHWRAIPGSTALASDAKSYARSAGVRALEDHFARCGIDAAVVETIAGNYRVTYALPPEPLPLVSLVIPTRDRVDLLRVCVDSLLERTDYPNFEIIVANNQSQEAETLAYFEQIGRDPRVRIVDYDHPFSFSGINNFAVGRARGEIVGLINNDIEVIDAGWLREMVSQAVRPEIGAVGAMLYYPDDRIQHAGVIVGLGGVAGHAYPGKPRGYRGQMNRAGVVQNLSCVTAACLLLRKSIYDEVNGLDEGLRVAFNDTDFCLRIRERGYRNLWTPWAELYHHESASRGQEDSPEKLARFNSEVDFMHRRWKGQIEHDPAYSPNLSLSIESFVLAWPPRVLYPFRTEASGMSQNGS